ncbi:hypothetical protein I4U23_028418 [Adineta vaga]|nr:hypothetical protein I4U23_028418 [Adineta vaga]
MREPMSLSELSNRQRLRTNQTKQFSIPDPIVKDIKPKRRTFYDESLQDMMAKGKSMFSYSGGDYIVDLALCKSDGDINYDSKPTKRKRKRPYYRQSIYHSLLSSPIPIELTQLTARGVKPELQMTIPPIKTHNNEPTNIYRHNAPPPTPQYDETEQLTSRQSQEKSRIYPSTQKLNKGKERYSQFHLPSLNLSVLSRQVPKKLSAKEVRSTLSNYLQNYY